MWRSAVDSGAAGAEGAEDEVAAAGADGGAAEKISGADCCVRNGCAACEEALRKRMCRWLFWYSNSSRPCCSMKLRISEIWERSGAVFDWRSAGLFFVLAFIPVRSAPDWRW